MSDKIAIPVKMGEETFQIRLPLLEYLTEVDPSKEWERRGFKATEYHNFEGKVTLNRIKKIVENRLDDYEERIQSFVEKSMAVYQKIHQKEDYITEEFLPSKKFVFIIGPPRSGGTYLLRELYKQEGAKLKNFHHKLASDQYPPDRRTFSWHEPESSNRLFFDIAQWLVWAKTEMGDFKVIPKKHYAFNHAFPLIDTLFGQNATYFITSRHPAGTAQSHGERHGLDDPDQQFFHDGFATTIVRRDKSYTYDQLENFSFNELVLAYWETYYEDFYDVDNPKGTLETLTFGSERETFINNWAKENHNIVPEPEAFEPTDRTYGEFWDQADVIERIRSVSNKWETHFGSPLIKDQNLG